jgi:hypothetical protein
LNLAIGLCAATICCASAAYAAQVTVLTGPPRTAVHDLLGPRLADALAPDVAVDLEGASGSWENLEAIAADPALVGFAQLGIFQRFVRERNLGDVLEYYGDVPVCVIAVARLGGPVTLDLDDAQAAFALKSVDTGPDSGDAALTFELMQAQVPSLQRLDVEHRGWSRALARIGQGRLDLVVFIEYPNSEVPLIQDVFANPRVVFVHPVARLLGSLTPSPELPFLPTQISIPRGGWFDDNYTGQTYCTSMGIVVHADGDPLVVEAAVRAVTTGVLTADQAESWWQYLAACLRGWAEWSRGMMASWLE